MPAASALDALPAAAAMMPVTTVDNTRWRQTRCMYILSAAGLRGWDGGVHASTQASVWYKEEGKSRL
jgi:hypothetical protein